MPTPRPRTSKSPDAARDPEAGVALVMALIFSILLYILVADLVVSSRMVRATGENDALLARMNTLMLYELGEAEEKLLADVAAAAAEGGSGGEGSEGEDGGGRNGGGGDAGGGGDGGDGRLPLAPYGPDLPQGHRRGGARRRAGGREKKARERGIAYVLGWL